MFDDKTILVTGGTGSFGQQFVQTVLTRFTPRKVIVFSRDETKQWEMQQSAAFDHPALRFFIGDIRDAPRLEMAFRGVDIVIHAAALKHIVAAEYNPFECIQTNVIGAQNVVSAAIRTGVERVLALSTDKAANPINLYGASKLASDKIFVAARNLAGADGPRFSVVRYGNVVGSRGSVIPLFQSLVERGEDALPITDVRMTRFMITLQQGVDFVLSSTAMMLGGEIFVPKIPSMKITEIAEAIGPGMRHKVLGIRPGEKLHESMITEADARSTLDLPDRYVVCAQRDEQIRYGDPQHWVKEGFRYSSDENTEWLDASDLRNLLAA